MTAVNELVEVSFCCIKRAGDRVLTCSLEVDGDLVALGLTTIDGEIERVMPAVEAVYSERIGQRASTGHAA
jgi:hypothetical protein